MIIYLHGFASTGNSTKVDKLRERFGDENVIAPDLPFDPVQVNKTVNGIMSGILEKWMPNLSTSTKSLPMPVFDKSEKLVFVGTSLGAFYANYFGHLYDCPTVLVNPSVYPSETLRKRLGINKNYMTNEEFLVSVAHLDKMDEMRKYISVNYSGNLLNLFLAKDDDVIPYMTALASYMNPNSLCVTEDGGHRYDSNWHLVLDKIEELLKV